MNNVVVAIYSQLGGIIQCNDQKNHGCKQQGFPIYMFQQTILHLILTMNLHASQIFHTRVNVFK